MLIVRLLKNVFTLIAVFFYLYLPYTAEQNSTHNDYYNDTQILNSKFKEA